MKSQNLTTTTQYFKTQNTATEGSGIYFGGMEFTPAPFVSMTLEKYSAGDYAVGGLMKVTLDGVFFGNNFSQTAAKLKSKITSFMSNVKTLLLVVVVLKLLKVELDGLTLTASLKVTRVPG